MVQALFIGALQFCPSSLMTSWKEGPEGRERSPWRGKGWGTKGDAEVDARVSRFWLGPWRLQEGGGGGVEKGRGLGGRRGETHCLHSVAWT